MTIASIATSSWWERRKLNRAERSRAYADFLGAFSRRWRAFGDRDGAVRRADADAQAEAEERVLATRDSLYDAYVAIQVLAPMPVVEKALACIRISDARNKAFKSPGTPGVGADARSAALADFVSAARKDLGVKQLDVAALKRLQDK